MIRLVVCFFAVLLSFSLNAVELVSGSLESIKNEYKIAISLDCSKCVYRTNNKNLPFEFFLAKAPRAENWELKSLEYFVDNFNKKNFEEGLMGVIKGDSVKNRYELIIIPAQIFSNGDIKGLALLRDIVEGETIAELIFSAEGDDDDNIVLRDPMKDAGEDIGNLFRKVLRGKKIKARSSIPSGKCYDGIYY